MTQEEYNQYVEDCIKAETETFYPEEFEARYGEKSRYVYPKTKIYTYYEDINFKKQDELLKLWKKSWSNNGFEPIVLSREDAKKSNFYEEFVSKISSLVFEIQGIPLRPYGLSCFLRWLAYSTQDEVCSFAVSDYDIINRQFSPVELNEPTNKLSFMDNFCPCLAIGTKEQYLFFCKDIINRTTSNLERIKREYITKKHTCYHDQDFLLLNERDLRENTIYNFRKPRKYVVPFHIMEEFIQTKRECKIIHFSHNSIQKTKEAFPEFKNTNSDELRLEMIKQLL